jgi:outer membrane protein assembly factor BamB
VYGDGLLFAANSYDWQALLAIRLAGARGDLTDTEAVVWKRTRLTPYVPSPLLLGDRLCFLRHNQSILSMVDTKTGEDMDGPFRLGGIREVFASPVAAAGRIYITDRSGNTLVLGVGEKVDFLGVNHLDDSFSASAAIVDDAVFLRGEKYLYCLAEEP